MKKLIVMILASVFLAGCSAPAGNTSPTLAPEASNQAEFSDEMKIPYGCDLDEYGADSVERDGDHKDSPYYAHPDFYNMKSTDTLTILPQFKTMQQTSEWSCGVTASLMVLDNFGKLGDYTEESLAEIRSNGLKPEATSLADIVKIFETVGGFEVESTYDYPGEAAAEFMTLDKIQELLKNNQPIIVGWNDWGGHWQVIIGYDTMGTDTYQDDVIIMADSYDTTDHNQDGYNIWGAERFYYNWTMYDFFTENYGIDERDLLFCTVEPIK